MTGGAISGAASAVRPPRLSPAMRARFVGEVLAAYVPMYRRMRATSLEATVAAARAVPPGAARPPGHGDALLAMRLGHITSRTLRPLPTDTRCLVRSLVLVRMLARRSLHGTLVIGVRRDERFAAHAWVEHEGRPVLPDGDYERLLEL